MTIPGNKRHPASFRDPSGFLFFRDGELYRQVNREFAAEYDRFVESGLYDRLAGAGWIVPHTEVARSPQGEGREYAILKPERIPFISYPYEWCFSQLKDAALATLTIQRTALDHGMILKDASGYNVQVERGKPVLIESLSFSQYEEGRPWEAYRQFCQHFLAPLALMSLRDVRLGRLLKDFIDGIPLDLAARLLPPATKFQFGLLTHIHIHAGAQTRYSNRAVEPGRVTMSRMALVGLIENLMDTIRRLAWRPAGTEWGDYYDRTNYTEKSLDHKGRLVEGWARESGANTIWDLGANSGRFSRLAAGREAQVIAFDLDPAAVEQNYLTLKREKRENLLPLVMDLANPSPALGWNHQERDSLAARGPADLVLALALVHHLAISNNLPLDEIASFLRRISDSLIIEFVPKTDSQVRKLLRSRRDVFPGYTREEFERTFSASYRIRAAETIEDSERTLYWMDARNPAGREVKESDV